MIPVWRPRRTGADVERAPYPAPSVLRGPRRRAPQPLVLPTMRPPCPDCAYRWRSINGGTSQVLEHSPTCPTIQARTLRAMDAALAEERAS